MKLSEYRKTVKENPFSLSVCYPIHEQFETFDKIKKIIDGAIREKCLTEIVLQTMILINLNLYNILSNCLRRIGN